MAFAIFNVQRIFQISLNDSIIWSESLSLKPAQRSIILKLFVKMSNTEVEVKTGNYQWNYNKETDRFELHDSRGLLSVSAVNQPAILVASHRDDVPHFSFGSVKSVDYKEDDLKVQVNIVYQDVNISGEITTSWEFYEEAFFFMPITYTNSSVHSVVDIQYFATSLRGSEVPSMESQYFVHPAMSECSSTSPVFPSRIRFDFKNWLGRGSSHDPEVVSQQWGLPVHYFCGMTINGLMHTAGSLGNRMSDAFCCGAAALPNGDLLFVSKNGKYGPRLRINGHIWNSHSTADGKLELGSAFCFTMGKFFADAIQNYMRALVKLSWITPRKRSDNQNEIMGLSQWNTWGAQMAGGPTQMYLTQNSVETIYDDMKKSKLNPGVFVIDAKWEGENGRLEHDSDRIPNFEGFLDRVRADGHRIGLWAAFVRCDNPASMGLTLSHMLCDETGVPAMRNVWDDKYYLFDTSQPEVQVVLRERAKTFMKRYRPDLVKFDFGYELPSLDFVAPKDRSWGGEIFLGKVLEVVVSAMREINPDVVLTYGNLSPLLTDHIDMHSLDDLYLAMPEYSMEANRRFFFSRMMGELGVPTYGSSGYSWHDAVELWFDTIVFGSVGSLGSFTGDPHDSVLNDSIVAKYNGFSKIARKTHYFNIEAIDAYDLGTSMVARAPSWVRHEGDELTALSFRTHKFDGTKSQTFYKDLFTTNVRVAITSLTDKGINTSSALGVVVDGEGEIALKRIAATVTIKAFGLNGSVETSESHIDNGRLLLRVSDHLTNGEPVTWTQILFT